MIDFNNFSSYFEFTAGLTGAFAGIKSFREELYNYYSETQEKLTFTNEYYSNINIKLLERVNHLKENKLQNFKSFDNIFANFEENLKNLDSLANKGSEDLKRIKYPLKITFIFSCLYSVVILLLIGLHQNFLTLNQEFQVLSFFNNIIIMNIIISVIFLFNPEINVSLYKYVFGLLFLFFLNKILLLWFSITFSNEVLLTICLITPFSPFVFQLLIEIVIRLKYTLPLMVIKHRLKNQLEIMNKTMIILGKIK